jgi:hypothetical protein
MGSSATEKEEEAEGHCCLDVAFSFFLLPGGASRQSAKTCGRSVAVAAIRPKSAVPSAAHAKVSNPMNKKSVT